MTEHIAFYLPKNSNIDQVRERERVRVSVGQSKHVSRHLVHTCAVHAGYIWHLSFVFSQCAYVLKVMLCGHVTYKNVGTCTYYVTFL